MARPKNQTPVYKFHKATGLARCWVGGRWLSLGKYGSPESRTEFARIVAELAAGTAAADVSPIAPPETVRTVDQVVLAFLAHAQVHYRGAGGKTTNEYVEYKRSVLHLHKLYGHTLAAQFGPKALAVVRQQMIAANLSRKLINQRVGRIKRVFKWAVAQELVPVTVHQSLATVTGLQKGRTTARERDPIKPVDPARVVATLPFLGAHVRAMVELHRLTGMRPGELCRLSLAQVDRSGDVWLYRPARHKTAHRGHDRVVPIGPKARAVLVAFLNRGGAPPAGFAPLQPGDDTARLVLADAYEEAGRGRDARLLRGLDRDVVFVNGCVMDVNAPVFSPIEAREERFRGMRAARKSKVQPSQKVRRKLAPKVTPATEYTPGSYSQAVAKAAAKAGLPRWHPNQLRHLFATEVRKAHGLEAAQVLLGHARADVTQVYAEKNLALAIGVAVAIG